MKNSWDLVLGNWEWLEVGPWESGVALKQSQMADPALRHKHTSDAESLSNGYMKTPLAWRL
jgi:hypothetical protein